MSLAEAIEDARPLLTAAVTRALQLVALGACGKLTAAGTANVDRPSRMN
jgi:hypothetical protein